MAEVNDKRRVFFALWPDAATAAAIARVADAVGADSHHVAPSQLHLTLAFVGAVGADEVTRLLAAAQAITVPAFTLRLDHLGYFKRPRLAWLGPASEPTALRQLASAVARVAGLDAQQADFRPHVSLARRVLPPRGHGRIEPVVWPVCSFCLVESGTAGMPGAYHCLRQWPLH